MKDIKKVLESFRIVCDHRGIEVDGVGDRNRKRHIPNQVNKARGGRRVRLSETENYDQAKVEIHEDAKGLLKGFIEKAKFKHENEVYITPCLK